MNNKNKFVNTSGEPIQAGTFLYFEGDDVYDSVSGKHIGIATKSIGGRLRVLAWRIRQRIKQIKS